MPTARTGDLLSLLRIAYLATRKSSSFAADLSHFRPSGTEALHERTEWVAGIFRVPLALAHIEDSRAEFDAQSQVPESAISGPTALMRLLTVLASRGVLEEVASWTALPEVCQHGVDLAQVQQIMSEPVIKKLLPLVLKRVTTQRENARRHIPKEPYVARSDYRHGAELAATLVSFDIATRGRWKASVRGARKELVLCLGNAAEMSNRVRDYKAALGFAVAAQAVLQQAPRDEGIPADVGQKNARRIATARSNVCSYY